MCILSYLHEISNNYINTFLFSTLASLIAVLLLRKVGFLRTLLIIQGT